MKRTTTEIDGEKEKKRQEVGEEEEEVGPKKPQQEQAAKKKKKSAPFEDLHLAALPSAQMYEKSFMHRAPITCIAVAGRDFVVTASSDGHVKFWKKQPVGVDFVKHFRAHGGAVTSLAASRDGSSLASACSSDRTLKIYDVANWDMADMQTLPFSPQCAEWISRDGSVLAVSDRDSPAIHIFSSKSLSEPRTTISSLHRSPVQFIRFNEKSGTVISIDRGGVIEYWSASPPHSFPAQSVKFSLKMDTDLFSMAAAKTSPVSLDVSNDGARFVVTGKDRKVRVFGFASGRLERVYDESLALWTKQQSAEADGGSSLYRLDQIDFGKRMAVEREIESVSSQQQSFQPPASNAVFDESGDFVLYPTPIGIKVVSIARNRAVRLLGMVESSTRFLCLALHQGIADDPTLFCAAHGRQRFYMFTKREPADPDESNVVETGRDVFNEKPTEEAKVAQAALPSARLARSAVIHTTMGDIHVKLFPAECPRTVENFTVHCKNEYYNDVLFHRVIRGFMIQTGDPKGDGTGGESIWGGEFEDEFNRSLKHDRPFTVSMANAGPNTNGSQFFITTVPLPRLDGKHTVFGRVFKGQEVVTMIEHVKTHRGDRPIEDIKIINIETSLEDTPETPAPSTTTTTTEESGPVPAPTKQ